MNPDWLLSHFNDISEAPDAVPRLRRFILDLAVRGKLVEQDPNDEPAVELLKRIGEEKKRLVKEGIRKEKVLPPVSGEEPPFQIPRIWQWSRLAEVGFVNPRNSADDGLQASFVPMPLISADYGFPNSHEVRLWGDIKSGYTHFAEGDVALAKITPCFENGKSAVFRGLTGGIGAGTTELHVLRPVIINPDYVLVFLKCPHFIENGIPRMTGTAGQKRVPTEYFACSPFPLPPIAEQHRIVAKVDELMALCDELEAAQQRRERRRDWLVAATLNGLNNGDAGSETHERPGFEENARFYFNHLPRLTARPEHIQQLRQTILNLAVRGKLVPQDPEDEPASELLKRIKAEKTLLEKEGKIGRENPVEHSKAAAIPFAIPELWKWTLLGELTELITKGSSPKWQGVSYVSKDNGVLFITSENVGNYRLRKMDELKYVEKRFNEIEPRSILRNGDILMNLVGASIGRTAVYDLHDGANINQAVALIRLIQSTPNLCIGFLLHYLNSPSAIGYMMGSQVVNAQPNISLTNAREFPIPFPPLTEQHRIVAKVDELMRLCDKLESRLSTTAIARLQLLEATLQEALKQPLHEVSYEN